MASLTDALRPTGRTSRLQYWIGIAAAPLAWTLAYLSQDLASGVIAISIIAVALVFLLILTLRRLGDAGTSRWWSLLMLFPIPVKFFFPPLELGFVTVELIDLGSLIRIAPIGFCLIAPSAEAPNKVESEVRLPLGA